MPSNGTHHRDAGASVTSAFDMELPPIGPCNDDPGMRVLALKANGGLSGPDAAPSLSAADDNAASEPSEEEDEAEEGEEEEDEEEGENERTGCECLPSHHAIAISMPSPMEKGMRNATTLGTKL